MSETQRDAILSAHERGTGIIWAGRGPGRASKATRAVMIAEGWITKKTWLVTTAGLIAAGVDMDAIHAEALEANACGSCGRQGPPQGCAINCGDRMDDALDEHATRGHVDNRAEIGAQRTVRYHTLVKAAGSFSAAKDALHAEALAEHERRFGISNDALAEDRIRRALSRRDALCTEIERARTEALDENERRARARCMAAREPAECAAAFADWTEAHDALTRGIIHA